jgi:hypothetical protein
MFHYLGIWGNGIMKKTALGLLAIYLSFAVIQTAKADDFLIKPYLYSILGTQIGVSWEYTTAAIPTKNPSLTLFRSGKMVQEIASTNRSNLFSVVLPVSPCGFGSDLSYQVNGQLVPVTITEVPCTNATNPARFTFLADAQQGTQYDKKFADLMAIFPGSGILNGGDLVQTGDSVSDWRGYFSSMESVGGTRVLFPAVGNHEYRDKDNAIPFWAKYFQTEAHDEHYAFDMGAARVIVINSNFESDPSLKMGQLEWLESELKLPSRWKIVFFHHPGYSVGFFTSAAAPKKEYVTVRDYYIPLFEKYKVDLVLNGHVHLFETSEKAGVHYIVVGPAGGKMGVYGDVDPYRIKSKMTRSIVNLEVTQDSLRAISTGMQGEILDNLLLTK